MKSQPRSMGQRSRQLDAAVHEDAAVNRSASEVAIFASPAQRRIVRTSVSGLRGVGGGIGSSDGVAPILTSNWGTPRPVSSRTTAQLDGTSVRWLSVHEARPDMVADNSAAERASPHPSTSKLVSSMVDNTMTRASPCGTVARCSR